SDQHRNAEPDFLGRPGDEGHSGEHVEIAAAGTFGLVGWDAQMIGDEERIETGLLRDSCAGANRCAIGLWTHVADCDCELHRWLSSGAVGRVLSRDWQARAHP